MHLTQTIIGGIAVLGALQFAVLEPIKTAMAPTKPIVINSLEYSDGTIIQDRTVNSEGRFTAIWTAQIIDVATGQPAPNCYGSGVWGYAPGTQSPAIPVAEWVGNDACRLFPGQYQAIATYEAGTFKATARSDLFEVRQ